MRDSTVYPIIESLDCSIVSETLPLLQSFTNLGKSGEIIFNRWLLSKQTLLAMVCWTKAALSWTPGW